MARDCPFCRIAAGDMSADELYRDDTVVAFRDLNPQAPTHVLVIPREHIASLREANSDNAALIGRLHAVAAELARDLGLADDGYRCVINCGRHGGQTVDHLHVHLLGGRAMGWPPFPRS